MPAPTSADRQVPPPPPIEQLLQRDRYIVGAALAIVIILCWAWIVPMARDMYGAMDGPSAWMMTAEWDRRHTLLLFAMWAVMMAGMMLPSAAPMILLYAGVRRRKEPARAHTEVYALGAGYLLVWTGFSVAATVLQRWMSGLLLLTPMMEPATPVATAALVAIAGVYQLTPLKTACLQTCRSPLSFIMREYRPGGGGAFRMGVQHGLYCLGCCWALMLLLFAGGVMNLTVIAALTIVVLMEKAAPFGGLTSRVLGAALILLAVWIFSQTLGTT